jgi:hypothetical protein
MRRIALLLALLFVLLPLALTAAFNRGTYFPEDTPTCKWTCASGSTGSANVGSLTLCRNACASACHGTCQILY